MSVENKTVLLVDDDAAIRTVLTQALSRAGFMVRSASTAAVLWRWVSDGEGDVVLSDVVLPDENIFDLLPRIQKLRPLLPIIVMSAQNTIMTAITAAERGAFDYLPKPFDLGVMEETVRLALRQSATIRKPRLKPEGDVLPIIGRSSAMQEIYRVIARLTQTDLTVLITGESGTGKELAARAIHDFGKRRKGAFVPINMAAIPRELIESELFGHEKGAFTGAQARSAGRFEEAERGTLFLDEIGDMPLEAQTRLLRVLQQGEYTAVGGHTRIKANVRIIAATHRDLRLLIALGRFREDLFYRLNVVPMRLPPLRERLEDVPDLVRHFMTEAEQQGLPFKQMAADAISALQSHRWPGNVRELQNIVRRLLAIENAEVIGETSVLRELAAQTGQDDQTHGALAAPSSASDQKDMGGFLQAWLAHYFKSFGKALPPPGLYSRILAEVEPPLLRATLEATGGNQIKAAALLGINRNTLRSKMRQRGFEKP